MWIVSTSVSPTVVSKVTGVPESLWKSQSTGSALVGEYDLCLDAAQRLVAAGVSVTMTPDAETREVLAEWLPVYREARRLIIQAVHAAAATDRTKAEIMAECGLSRSGINRMWEQNFAGLV